MDLHKLREHEDRALKMLEPLTRIEQLIALRYLRTLLGVPIDQTQREIMDEYRRELKGAQAK